VAAEISILDRLEPPQVADVLALVEAAADTDGTTPVSEHVLLHLRHGGDDRARNLLAHDRGTLVGYAHLDTTDQVEGSSAELAVHPGHRRAGVASALVRSMEQASPDGRLRLWAHGRHPDAAALARRNGYVEERVLWQMRRSLIAQLPVAPPPDGVRIRPFVVGADEEAWLRVNNRAFASHPEQGRWTVEDVRVREGEPWFDPAGLLLAERDGELLGFHWTKVHGQLGERGAGSDDPPEGKPGSVTHGHGPIGEVYVLGVDPDAQGLRLGAALTVAGLRHLRGLGLSQVMLYVDESNTRAVALYERLGFTKWDVDVQYRRSRGERSGS